MICLRENVEGVMELAGEPKKKVTKKIYSWARDQAGIKAGGFDNPKLIASLQAEILENDGYEVPEGLREIANRPDTESQAGVTPEHLAGKPSKVAFKSWTPVPDVWLQEFRQYFPMAKKGSPTDFLLYFLTACNRRGRDYRVLSYREIQRNTGLSNGYIAKLKWMFQECGILGVREGERKGQGKKRPDIAYRVLPEEYWKLNTAKVVRELWNIRERNRKGKRKVA